MGAKLESGGVIIRREKWNPLGCGCGLGEGARHMASRSAAQGWGGLDRRKEGENVRSGLKGEKEKKRKGEGVANGQK
jgi:hypothetical protein